MKVAHLINMLSELNPDANLYLDEDGYPSIDGAYNPDEYDGDKEDAPPTNAVLLEYSERK